MEKKLKLHADLQYYWKFEGAIDQMDTVANWYATHNNANEAKAMNGINLAKKEGAGDAAIRMNIASSYDINDNFSVTLFVMNLFSDNNKRYYYDSGSVENGYASRVAWVEEPISFGGRIDVKF